MLFARIAFTLLAVLTAAGAAMADAEPRIVAPGQAEVIPFPGHDTRALSHQHDTPTGTVVLELALPPKTFGAPPHVHTNEDEQFYVLEGSVDFLDRGEVVRASEGSLVILPRGHLHGFWNGSDAPARLLLVISPGDFGDFFDEVVAGIRRTHAENPQAVGEQIAKAAAAREVEIHFDKVPASAVHLLPH